jgi:hypothetical protein
MPIEMRLLPEYALVLATYRGRAGLQETLEAMQTCAADPDFQPHFSHLIDLQQVTDYERDLTKFFQMQARAIDIFPVLSHEGRPLSMVLIAPPGAPRGMAELVRRSWDGLNQILIIIQENEAQALSVLGLPHTTLADLRATQRPQDRV